MSGFIFEYREIDIFKGKGFGWKRRKKIDRGSKPKKLKFDFCIRMYLKISNKFFIHYFSAKSAGLITNTTRNIFTVSIVAARHFLIYNIYSE